MRSLKILEILAIVAFTAAFLIPLQVLPQSSQSKPAQPKKAAPAKTTTPSTQTKSATAAAPIDWPKEMQLAKGKLVIYQPQVDEWKDYKTLKARSAVAFQATGANNPQLGIIEMQANTEVDFDSRLVRLSNLRITGANFPGVSKEKNDAALAVLRGLLNSDNIRSVELDRILVSLERAGVKNVEVKNEPPKIFFSKKPAVLMMFDGQPVLSPIKDSDLKFVINTNWDVFYYEKEKTNFVRNEKSWLKSQNLNGPYTPADKLPDSFKKLPMNDNWKDVLLAIPPQKLKPEEMPVIFVSEKPAELIQLKGEPQYQPITQTKLTWVSNTDSTVIFNPGDSNFYYLVSGRWFKTKSLENGPWTFATASLPEEFKKIPAEHELGKKVRASIPGTREAEEAIIQAGIPQTAKINKKTAKAPDVTYAGDKPDFQPIESTNLKRAVNTEFDIIQSGSEYYLCYEGVWFVSKSPSGPWQVADKVPADIYKIPPSNPAYNVTYVTMQDDDNTDEWVTAAVTAGYFGTMIASDCVFWGTGYYYPPYYYYGGYYPYYYGYGGSYGAAAWYNPYSGTFGRSGWAYGPYGGVGYGARYNPRTGTYARGAAAYGPYGARGYAEAYNPRTGTSARTRQGSNYYSNWGSSAVRRGDDWVKTGHYRGQEGGGMRYRTSDGNSGFVGRNGDDLYAGRDGNVYRRSDSGWQNWDNGGWNNVDRGDINRPSQNRDTVNSLDRSRAERSTGNQRYGGSQNFQRSRSTMPRGGGGGGFRGGGGRRR